ncbi:helix-turn-helix transcriptional regulator [Kineococcus gynurae]|uniref:Helix-turn-helix transcriptional regulator n=1 Tax=Kineococcus gynurae TaxID=452979 RepID=A0ABV5LU75_9ACTN
MRADRWVSLVLNLRQHRRATVAMIAEDLGTSPRRVLRDLRAMAEGGVPVYREPDQESWSLLPGFRSELEGLGRDEILVRVVSIVPPRRRGPALDLALRAALRRLRREGVTPRLEVWAGDLTPGRPVRVPGADEAVGVPQLLRRALMNGTSVRLHYVPEGGPPSWWTVTPLRIFKHDGREHLVARDDSIRLDSTGTVRGGVPTGPGATAAPGQARAADHVFWVDRIATVQVAAPVTGALAVPAASGPVAFPSEGPARGPAEGPDLTTRTWIPGPSRGTRPGDPGLPVTVRLRLDPARRADLLPHVSSIRSERPEAGGWLRLEVVFPDARTALDTAWRLGVASEALDPAWLRDRLRQRATTITARYTLQA